MFCTQPPPLAKHHPLPSTSDPRTTTPSNKRKRVTIDVEGDDEDRHRLYYTKDEDIRLVSAWLHNSVNPTDGNAKKGEYYWKEVVDTFNSTTESDRKRDVKHLKNHWYKTTKK
uniref:Myb-like domain-containing protein n=1 Tax=Hordeum vulgare subsp. vulgare TaxID=112509 RepID=A0A8I6X1F3_HORVV